jgi:hypothetical protein
MTKFYPYLRLLIVVCFTLALASMAQAQATRTWVSGVGDDVNPCSRTAPCKTFAGAISKTFINGEIDCLDPGGFGAVTITKSMTIDGGSGFGSILASGTNGVIINIATNANDPNRRVTLRRLSINGTGASGTIGTATGIRGISITSSGASQVNVENCYIQNFTTAGIDMASAESAAALHVRDTNISNTGIGIQMNTTAGAGSFVLGMFERVRINKMTTGINSKDRSFITVRDSFISNCSTAGIAVVAPTNSNGLNVESTVLYSVTTGIAAGGAGTKVDISNTSILDNVNPATSSGATLNSHGNNQIANNVNPGSAFTIVGQQ